MRLVSGFLAIELKLSLVDKDWIKMVIYRTFVVGLMDCDEMQLIQQSMKSMVSQLGLSTDSGSLNGKNAASVMITAELPPFVKPGQNIDITVSTLGQQNH